MDLSDVLSSAAVLVSAGAVALGLRRQPIPLVQPAAPADGAEVARLAEENAALGMRVQYLQTEASKLAAECAALRQRVTAESLDEHAARAVAYAEQLGGTNEEKLRHALGAIERFDRDANGKQDWTPAQYRIAIEAALAGRAHHN